MSNLINDIENLESSITMLSEGASDEKRMALVNLQTMLSEKRKELESIQSKMSIDSGDGIKSLIMGFKI